MTEIREINFDMDGTLANLYGVEGWLSYLQNKDTRPYAEALPLLNLQALARRLNTLKRKGYKLRIISWLAKNSDKKYDEAVAKVKRFWLGSHLASVEWDEIVIVPYGTPKYMLGKGILFDDEEQNRTAWGEGAYDATEIMQVLKGLK